MAAGSHKRHVALTVCCPGYDPKEGGYLGRDSTLAELMLTYVEIWEEELQDFMPVELGPDGHRIRANTKETARWVTGPPGDGDAGVPCVFILTAYRNVMSVGEMRVPIYRYIVGLIGPTKARNGCAVGC